MRPTILFILLVWLLYDATATPFPSTLGKRTLEVNKEEQIIDKDSNKAVGSMNQKWKNIMEERMAKAMKGAPYLTKYRAFYNYDPLQEGKPPKAEAKPVFWPPEGTPDEIKQVKEEDSKKFHDVSVEVPGMPKLLQQLNDNEITIKRIAGLGFGSQNCFFANDLSHLPDYLRERIGKQVDDSDKQRLRRAAGQFRLGLTMQKQLPGGPELVLQDPEYSETDKQFMSEHALDGHFQIVDDPGVFSKVTKDTVFVNVVERPGVWYQLNRGSPLPDVIVSGSFDHESIGAPREMIDQYQHGGILTSSPDVTPIPLKFWIKKIDC